MATKAQKRRRKTRAYFDSLPTDSFHADLCGTMCAAQIDSPSSEFEYAPTCAPAKVCLYVTTRKRCDFLLAHGIDPRLEPTLPFMHENLEPIPAPQTRMFATWRDLTMADLEELLEDVCEDPVLLLVDTQGLDLDYSNMFDVVYGQPIAPDRVCLFESDWLCWEEGKDRFLAAGGMDQSIKFKRIGGSVL